MINIDGHFSTDTATLAIFDPERLKRRALSHSDWWCVDSSELPELQSGVLALVGLEGDGHYRVRVTDGELTNDERDYAAASVRGLGAEVGSGNLFIGPGECLPGGGSGFGPADLGRGRLIHVKNGAYDLDVFAIRWTESPRWWRDDSSVPVDAPADLVVIVRSRNTTFGGLEADPRLVSDGEEYLFESSTRQVGPAPGMLLTTKVRRDSTGGLCLKPCGPLAYDATLVDDSGVAWKDTIRVRVLRVDRDARRFFAEFVEKLEG